MARPGVTSNGAQAGPGDPLAANISPATSRRDAGLELSRTHSRGETKKWHLGYLEGAISTNIPPPPRQRAARSYPSSLRTAPRTPGCSGHQRGKVGAAPAAARVGTATPPASLVTPRLLLRSLLLYFLSLLSRWRRLTRASWSTSAPTSPAPGAPA